MVEFTDEQSKFLNSQGRVVLCACPGSGKTFLVATKLMNYIKDWNYSHQGVAVLSFTNVASDEIAKRFPVIIVDEAQDTSEEQMEIIDIIEKSGVETICLVGDPDQAIYEWRNATPECFEQKIQDKKWKTIYFTHNFRNSQHICNVTKYFAKNLEDKPPNTASGGTRQFPIKPILLLYSDKNSEDEIIEYFLKTCEENSISIDDSTLSVLTRGRIYENTDIKGLWKSRAVEIFAKSTYEWFHGSRKKAYGYAEKAFYELMIDDLYNSNKRLESKILEVFLAEEWKSWIIQI